MKTHLIALMAVLSACGTQEKKDTNSTPQATSTATAATPEGATSFQVKDQSNLPACNAEHAQNIAYVASTKTLMGCDGTTWAAVSLAQPAAAAVTPDHIVSGLTCTGPLTGTYVNQSAVYTSMTTSAGDTWVQAGISSTNSGESVVSNFYAASQKSATFPITMGSWTFSVTNNTLSVVMPTQTWSFPCTPATY